MKRKKTIVAIATAVGKSGIGIVRVSGTQVLLVVKKILKVPLKERYAHYLPFLDFKNNIIDQGIVLLFLAPNSFTGEDILEFHGHGNLIVLNLLIKNILLIPHVRLAKPGEFSKRAFLNKKIDLIQAESICDVINADSEAEIHASLQSLNGYFSKCLHKIIKKLNKLSVNLEISVNFPEEIAEKKFFFKKIENQLIKIICLFHKIHTTASQGCLIHEGIKVILTGPPNVGKSSLFNRLLQRKVSIVTKISGTTRDILREKICLNTLNIELLDTAGIHDNPEKIEKIGIKFALKEIELCHYIFLVLDSQNNENFNLRYILKGIQRLKSFQKLIIIFNKIDLLSDKISLKNYPTGYTYFFISVKKNFGISKIFNYLENISNTQDEMKSIFLSRQRHIKLLKNALFFLEKGKKDWLNFFSIECLLDNIRLAKNSIFQITGKFSHEELLKKIFSKFCIGK